MKKVVRLTESDLIKLIKNVIYKPKQNLNYKEKSAFKYLDMKYGDLRKYNPSQYDGVIFKKPLSNSNDGIIGWKKPETLYIHYNLVNDISNMFSLEENEAEETIGKWINDRYKLKVSYPRTFTPVSSDINVKFNPLKIDPQF